MTVPADLPALFESLRGQDWTEITLGRSDAHVWRIDLGKHGAVFLKSEPVHALSEVPGESKRLEWLARMGFKSPRLVDAVEEAGRHWLLMTAVPGEDLTHSIDRPDALCRILAQGLRRLHALDPTHCPFDHSLDQRIAAGRANVLAGRVDESDFEPVHQGWSAGAVLDWVEANRPPTGTLLVTHGDACVPNLLAEDGRFSGTVDCGRLGVADPWQDLALACRSITANCGGAYVAPFLAAYGAEWDPVKYRFYNALDELF